MAGTRLNRFTIETAVGGGEGRCRRTAGAGHGRLCSAMVGVVCTTRRFRNLQCCVIEKCNFRLLDAVLLGSVFVHLQIAVAL